MDKIKLRKKALKTRMEISPEIRHAKNTKIIKSLKELTDYKNATHILLYYSVDYEVNTLGLISDEYKYKNIYLPVIHDTVHLQAVPIGNPDKLKKGKYGIPEPTDEPNVVYDKQIEIVIIPGVAFDKNGNRLGMGKGFYDRYFQRFPHTKKIGLAYSEQILDCIPKDIYDVPIDMIITENEIIHNS